MGCDIHAHSEVKINGVWHHLSALNISRDYNLFAKMTTRSTMPDLRIRDVPADVMAQLKSKAALAGTTLQNYVTNLLTRHATARKPKEPK